jgi:tetratricopeptide (TPR) repeat protein
MVHVYAGNLLMTTGAYQDAIKAFLNADTVQKTAVAAFQRARCYCALTDLENAKLQFKQALDMQKTEFLVKLDSQCLTALMKVISNGGNEKTVQAAIDIIDQLI